jgi:hypothetical protein
MKVGIITDTHDQQALLKKAIEAFIEHQVDIILHAGDITSPSSVQALAGIDHVKFIGVFGNCDSDKSALESIVSSHEGEIQRGVYRGKIGEKKLLMAHDPHALGNAPITGDFDLIVYGHTHIQEIRRDGNTLVINPGHSWAVILDLDNMNYDTIYLD